MPKTIKEMMEQELHTSVPVKAREQSYAVASAVVAAMGSHLPANQTNAGLLVNVFSIVSDGVYSKIVKDAQELIKLTEKADES